MVPAKHLAQDNVVPLIDAVYIYVINVLITAADSLNVDLLAKKLTVLTRLSLQDNVDKSTSLTQQVIIVA